MRLSYCSSLAGQCEGHFSKYSDCLTQALHQASAGMASWADEEGGDVESPYGFRWLIIAKDQITVTSNDWEGGFDLHVAGGQYFVIVENDQGFVRRFDFATEDEARADWHLFDTFYGEWLGDDDE